MQNGMKTKIWEDFRKERRESKILYYLSSVSFICILISFPVGLFILTTMGLQRGQFPYPKTISVSFILSLFGLSYFVYKKNYEKSLKREKTRQEGENGN